MSMSSVPQTPKNLHRAAMDALDRARIAKWSGDSLAQNRCLHEAFELESKAADLLYDKLDAEPTRGVLYRSAGWIALDLGLTREAEILACKGLSGNPPKSVQEELRRMITGVVK